MMRYAILSLVMFLQTLIGNASEVEHNEPKIAQNNVNPKQDSYVHEVATSYGLSTDELKEKAIDFIDQRTVMMQERKHHISSDQPTSINDLILVKKVDPSNFVDKFNEFLRRNGKEGSATVSDFDFNYPMFLVPLDTN